MRNLGMAVGGKHLSLPKLSRKNKGRKIFRPYRLPQNPMQYLRFRTGINPVPTLGLKNQIPNQTAGFFFDFR